MTTLTRTTAPPGRASAACSRPSSRRSPGRHARRTGLPPPCRLAGPGRHRRARPVRDDRRGAHPHARRARTAHRADRRDRRRAPLARSDRRDRRNRHERHGRDDRGDPARGRPSAPMRRSSSRRTTTARTGGCSRPTSGRSPTKATCRSSSTTSRRGRARTSTPTRSSGWPSIHGSSAVKEASRQPRADRPDLPRPAARRRRSWPATTPGRCRPRARRRWCRVRREQRDPRRDGRAVRGGAAGDWDGARRIHERWLPLMLANFPAVRTRSRSRPPSAMGLIESDLTRRPLLPLEDARARGARRAAPDARAAWPHRPDGRRDSARTARAIGVTAAVDATPRRPRGSRGRAGCGPPAGPDRAGWLAGRSARQGGDPRPVRRPDHPGPGRSGRWPSGTGSACRRGSARPSTRSPRRGRSAVAIVPGGTSIRAGAHLEPGVVVMPPAFINIGAWIGEDAMIDSHVLVGSCAQIGARVHLAAGVQDRRRPRAARRPPGHRRGRCVRRSRLAPPRRVLVRAGAVIAAGVTLTGTSTIYDTVARRSSRAPPIARRSCRPAPWSCPAPDRPAARSPIAMDSPWSLR